MTCWLLNSSAVQQCLFNGLYLLMLISLFAYLFVFNFLRSSVECLVPHWMPFVVGIFFGSPTRSQISTWKLIIDYECLVLAQNCLTSSFNFIYPVSIHLHFASGLFTFLSSCMCYFPVSSLSVWLAPGFTRASFFFFFLSLNFTSCVISLLRCSTYTSFLAIGLSVLYWTNQVLQVGKVKQHLSQLNKCSLSLCS